MSDAKYERERGTQAAGRKSGHVEPFDSPRSEEGRSLHVSESLAGKIHRSFGLDASQLKFEESPQVKRMGMEASAQGNRVRFAPGRFQPETQEGMETLGHELGHVVQQAKGQAPMTGGVLRDSGLEAGSDAVGQAFASGGLSASGPVSAVTSSSAPVQGRDEKTRKQQQKEGKKVTKMMSKPGRNKMVNGKRIWDARHLTTDQSYAMTSEQRTAAENSRRDALKDMMVNSKRGGRAEIQDLFEAGQGALMDYGKDDTADSTYDTMMKQFRGVRENSSKKGSTEAADAYTIASEGVNDRILSMLQEESKDFENLQYDKKNRPKEIQDKIDELTIKVYEEYARELENRSSLLSGIADSNMSLMNEKLSFTKMEGGQALAGRAMVNDMILKSFGPYMYTKLQTPFLRDLMQNVSHSTAAPLRGENNGPVSEKFMDIVSRYNQSKANEGEQNNTAEAPEPEQAPAPQAAKRQNEKKRGGFRGWLNRKLGVSENVAGEEEERTEARGPMYVGNGTDIYNRVPIEFEGKGGTIRGSRFTPKAEANGKKVVLYSGSGGSAMMMQNAVEEYTRSGFTVYLMDYRGYGQSQAMKTHKINQETLYQDAEDIYDFAKADSAGAASAESSITVHGFSLGGAMASHVANVHAQDKIGDTDQYQMEQLVMHSAIDSTRKQAKAQGKESYGPLAGLAGKLAKWMFGNMKSKKNLKGALKQRPDMKMTFMGGDEADHLNPLKTNLVESAEGYGGERHNVVHTHGRGGHLNQSGNAPKGHFTGRFRNRVLGGANN